MKYEYVATVRILSWFVTSLLVSVQRFIHCLSVATHNLSVTRKLRELITQSKRHKATIVTSENCTVWKAFFFWFAVLDLRFLFWVFAFFIFFDFLLMKNLIMNCCKILKSHFRKFNFLGSIVRFMFSRVLLCECVFVVSVFPGCVWCVLGMRVWVMMNGKTWLVVEGWIDQWRNWNGCHTAVKR